MRLLGFLFILPLTTFSQNLIPNGGFEDENICTEYSKNCAPEAWIATSLRANYYFDDQPNAHGGSHFVGLIIGNISRAGYRSFVRTQLLCRPKKGHEYTLDFFIRSDHPALDSIGIYFSATDFLFDRRNFKQITPQLWSKQGIEFSGFNPGKWYHVDLEYTASGDEQYLTIGNFKKNEYSGFGQAEYEDNYYFFLDDVSLIPKDPREHLCPECDSIKNVIYAQNDRHQLLERKIYLMRKNPPNQPILPSTVILHVDTLIIPDIFFATAKFDLTDQSSAVLESFCTTVKSRIVDSLVIEGNTDSVGKTDFNENLSLNRARSVRNFIHDKT
ncbi:MAG TPA: OmpA family protein, partial [Puia sp.]|nr:OmpA family protein [Puia sp.]